MNLIHEKKFTKEILSFLKSNLGSFLSNYMDQLSLNANPHIIVVYYQSEVIGVFLGERSEQIATVYELKLIVFKIKVQLDSNFWNRFRESCIKVGLSVVVCLYLDSSMSINIPIEDLSRNFHCSDVIRMGINYEDYVKIESSLGKTDLDYLVFGRNFPLNMNGVSKIIQAAEIGSVSIAEYIKLYDSYREMETQRIIKKIINRFPEYQTQMLIRTLKGDFGVIDKDISMALRCEGELIGYILVTINERNQAFILEVNVHPKFQGLGLGALLVRNSSIKCFEYKKCTIVKGLIEKNHLMRDFYEKWGSTILKEGKEGIWIL